MERPPEERVTVSGEYSAMEIDPPRYPPSDEQPHSQIQSGDQIWDRREDGTTIRVRAVRPQTVAVEGREVKPQATAAEVRPQTTATKVPDEPGRAKLTVNLPEREMTTLRSIAARRDISLTDVIRRAIAMEQFIEEVESQGGKLLVEQRDRSLRQLVLR